MKSWPTKEQLEQLDADLVQEAATLGFDLRRPPTVAGPERDTWLAKYRAFVAQRREAVSAEYRALAQAAKLDG